MNTDRNALGKAIASRIRKDRDALRSMWLTSTPVQHFVVDDLLPADEVSSLAAKFPDPQRLMLRSTLRERKRVGVDVRQYDPIIGEYLFAFHHPDVVGVVSEITELVQLEPDPSLYASGISLMGRGDFLNPHVDNSHDGDGRKYRMLNLLFYASPSWSLADGGNFELWNSSVTEAQTVVSRFNRLVVMRTNRSSWHSVSPVVSDKPRLCCSNYYFSTVSPEGLAFSHVTTFTGRPEEPFKKFALTLDGFARNTIARIFPAVTRLTKHRIKD